MRYVASFRTASTHLVLAGFLPLFLTGRIGLLPGFAFLAFLGWMMVSPRAMQPNRSPEKAWKTALGVFLILAVYLLDTAWLAGDFIVALVHVSMGIIVLKLSRPRRTRDIFYVALLALGFLLITTLYSFDIVFLAFAAWFFVAGVLTLMLLEIRVSSILYRNEAEKARGGADGVLVEEMEIPVRARSLAFLGLRVFLATVVLAVPLFLGLPRLAFGLLQWNLSRGSALSGFTESTHLGDAASINLSQTVVMRVKVDRNPAELPLETKWRGIALDQFDGRSWNLSPKTLFLSRVRPGEYHQVGNPRPDEVLLRQEFYVEPLGTQTLFMARRPRSVSWEAGPVLFNSSVVRSTVAHMDKFSYVAFSDVSRPTELQLDAAPPVDPNGFPHKSTLEIRNYSFRLAALVRRVTAGAPNPYRKAVALARYLRENYKYSLEIAQCPADRLPVEFFLFETRRGHCEYFASSLAVMLRYAGIPSRLVNGFQRGEVSPISGAFIVRQADAHSWVEAWFPGLGWLDLDATPPGAPRVRGGLIAFLEDLFEYIHFLWISQVVNYDVADQSSVFGWIRGQFGALSKWGRDAVKAIEAFFNQLWRKTAPADSSLWVAWAWRLAAGAGLLVGALLLRKAWRRFAPRRRRRPAKLRRRIRRLIARLFRVAAAAGFPHSPGETVRELLTRLAGVCPGEQLGAFDEKYHRLRFDPACEPGNMLEESERLLREITRALKRSGRPSVP